MVVTMHETINVNFKMNINNDGQNHEIQFHELGKRYHKNKKTFIRFKEPALDGDKYNQLMFICDNNEIIIIRNGFVNMKQPYIENKLTNGFYNNEYMSSEITTFTNKYRFSDEFILLNYDIVFDKDIIGSYQMEVKIKGVGDSE